MKRSDPDPLQELAGVQHRMNRLFESALARTDFEAEGGFGGVFDIEKLAGGCAVAPQR